MSSAAAPPPPDDGNALIGIPNIGPARRAALEAAGVTTRAQLARASVDQLVGMTGMARGVAQKTLEFVRHTATAALTSAASAYVEKQRAPDDSEHIRIDAAPVAGPGTVASSETPASLAEMAAEVPVPDELPPAVTPEDGDHGLDVQADIERLVLRAQTALSDLTRVLGDAGGKRRRNEANRLAALIDTLPGRSDVFKPKTGRRMSRRLEKITTALERLAKKEIAGDKRAQQRCREVLRDGRTELEALVKTPGKKGGRAASLDGGDKATKPDKTKPDKRSDRKK